MNDVSVLRLYLLRAVYLLIAVGLGIVVLPGVVHPAHAWSLTEGVVKCMLVAFGTLSLLGVRYPLLMLPVLLWELLWKTLWMLIVALPMWLSGTMDEATLGTAIECLAVVMIPLVLPWGYLFARYVRQPGDRWHSLAKG